MILEKLKGTGVAVITPFNSSHQLDEKALENILQHLVNGQVEYVVMLGTTGESVTLNKEEKKRILELTRSVIGGRIPVVAGVGGNNTTEVVQALESLDATGIDAILSVSPYYNKPTQTGLYHHYKAVAEASPRPVILYNVPGRTSSNITAETTLKLAHEVENIAGIKEASGNIEQCMAIIKDKPEDFLVVSGDDILTMPLISAGMHGVISVIANAYPKEYSDMVRASLAGDLATARALHYRLFDITQKIYFEGNPGGIKALMHIKGLCENELRLPLYKVSDGLYEKLKQAEGQLQ